jgi:hypothetical protein
MTTTRNNHSNEPYRKMTKEDLIAHVFVLRENMFYMKMKEAARKESYELMKQELRLAKEEIKRLSKIEMNSYSKDTIDDLV